jgi:hypothetical protein
MVSRRELFDKMPDQRQVCGKMAMLSAHDRRIMYIPMGNLYPTDLNRNTFFRKIANNVEDEDGSSGGYSEECRLDSLYQYAVLIGKTPLDKEFNSIYTSVYTKPSMEPSIMMNGFIESTKKQCLATTSKAAFDSDVLMSSCSPPQDTDVVETNILQNDDDVLVLYATENFLIDRVAKGEPIELSTFKMNNNQIKVPATSETRCGVEYRIPNGGVDDAMKINRQHALSDSKPLGCSGALLQDVVDTLCISTYPAKMTECRSRRAMAILLMEMCSKQNQRNVGKESDAIRIAESLLNDMQNVIDLGSGTEEEQIVVDPLVTHLSYLNMIFGKNTAMNINCPLVDGGNSSPCLVWSSHKPGGSHGRL